MELFQLRYFLKVAENLSFRRAAKMLFISQPALSQQIKELENELGTPLFYRDNQGVRLLPAGEIFRERAAGIVEQADELVSYMQKIGSGSQDARYFRIGFDRKEESLAGRGITDAIYAVTEKDPQLQIELNYVSFEQAKEEIAGGELDVGFFVLREADYESFKYNKEVLWKDELCFAVHNSLPGTAKELFEKYPLIQLREDERWESVIRKKVKRICPAFQVIYVDSITKSLDYVAIKKGIIPGILSQVESDPNLRALDVKSTPEDRMVIAALWGNGKKENVELISGLLEEIRR